MKNKRIFGSYLISLKVLGDRQGLNAVEIAAAYWLLSFGVGYYVNSINKPKGFGPSFRYQQK